MNLRRHFYQSSIKITAPSSLTQGVILFEHPFHVSGLFALDDTG